MAEHIEGTALQQRRFEERTAGLRRCPDCHRWGRHYCYGEPVQLTNGRNTGC